MKTHLIMIPAHNEEGNIATVLEDVLSLDLGTDILVINDGSSDQTENIVKSYPVFLVTHPVNLGYAATLQTGFKFAYNKGYQYVIQLDGDGQHDVQYIHELMYALSNEQTDIVLGSRFLQRSQMNISWAKLAVIKFFRAMIMRMTGKKVTDPTSGFRGYKVSVFHNFVKPNFFPNEYPDSNLIIELLLQKYRLVEVPVNMKDRMHGVSMHAGFKSFIYMFHVMLSIVTVMLRHTLRKRVSIK
ncbi:MAG: glycosyltransferase family 2 protein [Bacillota bacterium]|nr:glycosyltransferase family 2 protein [Bacillota bacterium]MDP4170771.1 glycosyltransferase family 2 protein [Bacillota bacterium]